MISRIYKWSKKIVTWFLICVFTLAILFSIPQIFHKNKGVSTSIGSVGNGKLINGYLVPYSGVNYCYFSLVSYYVIGDAYTNSKLSATLLSAYKECEATCPGICFRLMECSKKNGGKMLIHYTHQNGLSIDFMTPLIQNGKPKKTYDDWGSLRYQLLFDEDGKLNRNKDVKIDFETVAKHIIALDNAVKKHGLTIQKVILKIDLKDDLFKTEPGKELLRRKIYFARALPPGINAVHGNHYHIDFKVL
jgi:penicillin-insensitive murein endopeptidase